MRRIIKYSVLVLVVLIVTYLCVSFALYQHYRGQFAHSTESVAGAPVAIVFGAGLKPNGTPSDVLKDRLIVSAELYRTGKVERILVSGDNSTPNYDEPTSMLNYLVEHEHIPVEAVFADFAGRRTYDTCARAHTIWGINHAVLVTQAFHLPRAMLLCAGHDIKVQGVSASRQPYVRDSYYNLREVLAFQQAMFERFLLPPLYIGGNLEQDLDPS